MNRLTKALSGIPSNNKQALVMALYRQGYNSHLKLHKDHITLKKAKLGDHRDTGYHLTLTRGKKELSAMHFGNILIRQDHWDALEERFDKEMKRWKKAVKVNKKKPLPVCLETLKTYTTAGDSKKRAKKKAKQAKEIRGRLDALGSKIKTVLEAGNGPSRIVIYSDGPDAAGKSSTGAVVLGALDRAGYNTRTQIFKLPVPGQHWLKRFIDDGVPNHQSVVFWDRGPAGDCVYGPHGDRMNRAMTIEFNGFEARLQAKGILLLKMQIYATREKQCKTFGKRLAREVIAEGLLNKAKRLTRQQEEDLELVAYKVDGDDYRSFENYQATEDKFMLFATSTQVCSNWLIEDASDRHACRVRLIKDFNKRINLDHKSWAYHHVYEF